MVLDIGIVKTGAVSKLEMEVWKYPVKVINDKEAQLLNLRDERVAVLRCGWTLDQATCFRALATGT